MNEQQNEEPAIDESTLTSPRFAKPRSRRDFLGLTACWSALGTCVVAAMGALRLPMPSVFPESDPKVKVGPPEAYAKDSQTLLPEASVWIMRDRDGGLFAISTICTHLGCIVKRVEDGGFVCPCHGSVFAANGDVISGPAPAALQWMKMSLAPDGQIVIDKMQAVEQGTKLVV